MFQFSFSDKKNALIMLASTRFQAIGPHRNNDPRLSAELATKTLAELLTIPDKSIPDDALSACTDLMNFVECRQDTANKIPNTFFQCPTWFKPVYHEGTTRLFFPWEKEEPIDYE